LTACPAQGKDFRKCGLLNHYSKVCRNPKARTKKQQGIYIDPSPPTLAAVNTSDLVELAISPEKWTSSFMINFLPDAGADLDAIPESLYKRKLNLARWRCRKVYNQLQQWGARLSELVFSAWLLFGRHVKECPDK
jgi:hypothetical protein